MKIGLFAEVINKIKVKVYCILRHSGCWSFLLSGRMYADRVARCPLVSHGEYADGTERHTNRRKDARPLHYAFRYRLDPRNDDRQRYKKHFAKVEYKNVVDKNSTKQSQIKSS